MKKVFLAGEGRHELGGWFDLPPYRDTDSSPGVLETLLRKVAPEGDWQVGGAVVWKNIRSFKVGGHRTAESRKVLGAAQMAKEANCDVLAFTRDRDRSHERQRDVEVGMTEAGEELEVAGGVAIENLDAWILALRGERESESLADPKSKLSERGIQTTEEKVEAVQAADVRAIPPDAKSLQVWLDRAREVLTP
ncbi:MAG: hypothetical protein L6R30_25895 [Thermoanaerobaculia bacterium]|nr:hypothetical protein [Thermoanaerobaculia bacterium]